jgi:hypothetical protein
MNSFGNFNFLVGKNGSHSEMRISGCDTCYAERVFLHPVGSTSHVTRNVDVVFLMLGWARCCFCQKLIGTRYDELVFLHLV